MSKVVQKCGAALLVEWNDNGLKRRSLLPTSIVQKHRGNLPKVELERGLEQFTALEEVILNAEFPSNREVLAALRESELWSCTDAIENISRLRDAFALAFVDAIRETIRECHLEERDAKSLR